jgi:hypothetical protein
MLAHFSQWLTHAHPGNGKAGLRDRARIASMGADA